MISTTAVAEATKVSASSVTKCTSGSSALTHPDQSRAEQARDAVRRVEQRVRGRQERDVVDQ